MIGALAYFGILSPSRFLPERCNVGPEFSCNEYRVTDSNGRLSIIFSNNVGQTIGTVLVTNARWAQEDLGANPAGCTVVGGPLYRAGDPIEVQCDFNNALFPPTGAKVKFNVDMTYIPQGQTYTKPLTAEVYTALQP